MAAAYSLGVLATAADKQAALAADVAVVGVMQKRKKTQQPLGSGIPCGC